MNRLHDVPQPLTVARDGDSGVVRIPMKLKRRGGRKEIIVPEGLENAGPPTAPAQEPLVRAVARAFAWQEMLESEHYASVTALAEALGVDRSYVRRILSLACLAPDIVEAIARGDEPGGLSLEKMAKQLPMLWAEQRERIGFPVR